MQLGCDYLSINKINAVLYPLKFNSDYICAYDPYFTEKLMSIITTSGREEHIKAKFKQRLKYLESNEEKVFLKRDWFENPVKYGSKRVYFIKIKDANLNIRISFMLFNICVYGNKKSHS